MSDISSSEKRLIAALDRIEGSLTAPSVPSPDKGALQAAQQEVARLTAALAAREADLAALTAAREAEVTAIGELIEQIEGALDEPAANVGASVGAGASAGAGFGGVYGSPDDDRDEGDR